MFTFHWLILRITALFIIIGFLSDIEIIILIFGFLFLHISIGLKTIVYDYIHLKKIKFMSLILIRISTIEVTRYILELFI